MSSTDQAAADPILLQPPAGTGSVGGYTLLATAETVQVLSTELVVPSIRATIRSDKSGIIGTVTLPTELVSAGGGAVQLDAFAANLELIQADSRVSNVTAAPDLDDNNLLQDMLTITVAYRPPGSVLPPLTLDISVPYSGLGGTGSLTAAALAASSVGAAITSAYAALKALAGA